MDRAEQQEMQDAFEKSRHYFQGEGSAERTVAWSVWKDAWMAARTPKPVKPAEDA